MSLRSSSLWPLRIWKNWSRTEGIFQKRQGLGQSRRFRSRGCRFGEAAEVLEQRLLLSTIVVDDDGGADQTTIQAAIDAATDGDRIQVTGGADCIQTEAGITVNKDVTIQGFGSGPQVIVQAAATPGGGVDRVFHIAFGTAAAIDSLTIQNGHSTEGGGILNEGDLTLTNSTVAQNLSDGDGGGISNFGSLNVNDSALLFNLASGDGGGISNSGFLNVNNTTVLFNLASGDGGAISNFGTLNFNFSTLNSNAASGDGGGISNSGGLSVFGSTLSNNSASGDGGGIADDGSNGSIAVVFASTLAFNVANGAGGGASSAGFLAVGNSTVSNNSAGLDGGGIDSFLGLLLVTSSTITGNTADSGASFSGFGGGISAFSFASEVDSSIVAGNFDGDGTPDDIFGTIDFGDFNLVGDANSSGGFTDGQGDPFDFNNNIVGNFGSGTIDITTVLDPVLSNNLGPTLTHNLVIGSPAIDAGSNTGGFSFDQRGPGFFREEPPGLPDIGAVEFIQFSVVDDDTNGDYLTIQDAIDAAIDGFVIFVTGGADRTQTEAGITVDKDVSIRGFAGVQTVVQAAATPGTATDRVFDVSPGVTAMFDSLVILNGHASIGGGIRNRGNLTVNNSVVTQNTADSAGGGVWSDGPLSLFGSIVAQNASGSEGGGVWNGGSLLVFNSGLSSNSAGADGGGLFDVNNATIFASTVDRNVAGGFGGGVSSASLVVADSTLSGNTSGSSGGGIDSPTGFFLVTNSTITGNTADSTGGGISIRGTHSESALLASTIVAGNFIASGNPSDIYGMVDLGIYNLIGDANSSGGLVDQFAPRTEDPSQMAAQITDEANQNTAADSTMFDPGQIFTKATINPGDRFDTNKLTGDPVRTMDPSHNVVGNSGTGTLDIHTVLDTNLQNNGGFTPTHALVPGSPALNAGLNPFFIPFDQRGNGFLREDVPGFADIGAVEGQDLFVDDDGFGSFLTIQAAIEVAHTGDFVIVTGGLDGIHTEQGITFDNDVTIVGLNVTGTELPGVKLPVIQAAPAPGLATDRVFNVPRGAIAAIQNVTIRYGNNFGGGILNDGVLKVTNSTITQNSSSLSAGGISTNDDLTLVDSTVSGNVSMFSGGGIGSLGGTIRIRTSTISGNTTQAFGGGVSQFGGALEITDSTISGNTAGLDGGGVYMAGAFGLSIVSSTITENTTFAQGGGVSTFGTNTYLESTIVAGNAANHGGQISPNDISGFVNTARFNLIGDAGTSGGIVNGAAGNIVGNNGQGTIDIHRVLDPVLRDNGGPTFTHALFAQSLALDTGTNPLNLATDQRGSLRFSGAEPDIGAFELEFHPRLVAGVGSGAVAEVRVIDPETGVTLALFPFVNRPDPKAPDFFPNYVPLDDQNEPIRKPNNSFVGGVRVALADVTGDGVDDIITAAGTGGSPRIRVFDGNTGFAVQGSLGDFYAYNPLFYGGVYVAAGYLDDDEYADVIVGAGETGGPHVRAYSGFDGSILFDFFAYDPNFRGGVRVASGDVTGDGISDIITAAGPGGGPHVRVFDGSVPIINQVAHNIQSPLGSFYAYDPSYTGGVYVGGVTTAPGSSIPLIVTGSALKVGGAEVRLFSAPPQPKASFNTPIFTEARVASADFDGDGVNDFFLAPGTVVPGEILIYSGDPAFNRIDPRLPFGGLLFDLFPFGTEYYGGLYIAGPTGRPVRPPVPL